MRAAVALLVGIVVVLLLRSTALAAFASHGIVLDVLAFATVVWALRHGEAWGASFGFALGLAADLDAAHWLGRHALALTLVGYVAGRLASTLVRESTRTQLVLVLAATAEHQAWTAAFDAGGFPAWPTLLLARVVVGPIVTALSGALVLAAVRRASGGPLFANVSIQPGQPL